MRQHLRTGCEVDSRVASISFDFTTHADIFNAPGIRGSQVRNVDFRFAPLSVILRLPLMFSTLQTRGPPRFYRFRAQVNVPVLFERGLEAERVDSGCEVDSRRNFTLPSTRLCGLIFCFKLTVAPLPQTVTFQRTPMLSTLLTLVSGVSDLSQGSGIGVKTGSNSKKMAAQRAKRYDSLLLVSITFQLHAE